MITLKIKDFLQDFSKYVSNKDKIISIAGGSGSGKSCLAKKLSEKTNMQIIKLDDYIIPEKITPESNWDLPECWHLNLVRLSLIEFIKKDNFQKQIYDFKTRTNDSYEIIFPNKNIILEGLYSFHDSFKELVGLKIFIDINEEKRLNRVLKRDVVERGNKTNEKIIKRWNETIQPAYLDFVEPQKSDADIVLI